MAWHHEVLVQLEFSLKQHGAAAVRAWYHRTTFSIRQWIADQTAMSTCPATDCVRWSAQGMMTVPEEEDVRALLLRHEGAQDSEVSRLFAAYATTQPTKIFSEEEPGPQDEKKS